MTDWRERALALADELVREQTISPGVWHAAFAMTPRHTFVPKFHTQRDDATWVATGARATEYAAQVYSNIPLVTTLLPDTSGRPVAASSSSKPGLMGRMLEALDVRDGHRVAEIGTGTGYNAALLSYRLDADYVSSVDISPTLVGQARERLAFLGYAPHLVVADGSEGIPERAPFDRLIATCSVPRIPAAWRDQVVNNGIVLADLKVSMFAGNLVRLVRRPDRLEGRFAARWAGFMPARHDDSVPQAPSPSNEEHGDSRRTRLPAELWDSLIPWFLAATEIGTETGHGTRGPWVRYWSADGSWASVSTTADESGEREVRQGGPVALWDIVERAYQRWTGLGRPGWERFGLTVLPDHEHVVWLDDPDGEETWPLYRR